ncbi:MAG: STN domain-containing protein, partial [Pseudomonadota bacterium]
MVRTKFVIAALVSGCSLAAISTTANAQDTGSQAAANSERAYNIPAQPLQAALNAFAEASGSDLLYASDLVDGKQSSAVNGNYSAPDALRILLRGTGLAAAQVSGNVFSLQVQGASASSDAAASPVSGIVRSAATGSGLPGAEVEVLGTNLR